MESLKSKTIQNSFAQGIRPEQELDIKEWTQTNVKLSRSDRSNYADLELTPHLIQPLQTIIDNDYSEIILQFNTGAGKSTLFEILACYIALEKPCPTLYIAQTQPAAEKWMELGITPTLKNCEKLKPLWPSSKNRHAVKKSAIHFAHFPLYVLGPAKSNLQGLSIQNLIIDEAWMIPDGHIAYAKKRTHDRAFRSIVLAGQSGTTSCEFNKHWETSHKHEWMFHCPSCEEYHPFKWENMIWDKDQKIADMSPEYHCDCGHVFHDTPETRRSLAQSSKFVSIRKPDDDPTDGRIGFTMNAMGVMWIEWKTLLIEWLEAMAAKKKGDYSPLEKFKTQRLCQPWDDSEEIEIIPIRKSGYSLTERLQYEVTILTVDTQGAIGDDHFWFTVRTWTRDGRSRLLDFGRFSDINQIEAKQIEWGIPPNQVAIDSAYKTDMVQNYAASKGYITLNGQPQEDYSVTINGKTRKRIYSKITDKRTTSGKLCKYAAYSSNRSKTILAALKASENNSWEIPHDISDTYINQLNAEKLVDGQWKQTKKDNHATDMEAMSLIMAIIHKCYMNNPEI